MKQEIEDVIIDGAEPDHSLSLLIELALLEILDNRLLFPNPLDEPVFYRRNFKKWVADAIREKKENEQAFGNILGKTTNKLLNLTRE